jgi:hypothetical protein
MIMSKERPTPVELFAPAAPDHRIASEPLRSIVQHAEEACGHLSRARGLLDARADDEPSADHVAAAERLAEIFPVIENDLRACETLARTLMQQS